jgi:hypothetical protein
MTRYTPLWQQAGTYPASVDRGLLSTLWPTSGSSGGAVTTVANTMTTSVAPGTAAVALTSAANLTQLCRWDAAEVVTHAAAPPAGSSRIDLVVLQVRDNTLDAGGNNDFIFQAIQGAGGTPGPGAVPAVPTNAYPMGQLTVPGGAANLNGVTVTDRRLPLIPQASPHCEVYLTTPQSVGAGTITQVTFDTVEGGTGWDMTNHRYVCPVAGRYLVDAIVTFNHASGALQFTFALVRKNGVEAKRGATIAAATAVNAGSVVSGVVACAAGDTLDVAAYVWNALPTLSGAAYDYAQFTYLGP